MFNKTFKSVFLFVILAVSFLYLPQKAFAVATYGSGYYMKLCGETNPAYNNGNTNGVPVPANPCNRGCSINGGYCNGLTNSVAKWVCDGKTTDCRSNEQWGSSQNLGGVGCGKTVQLDVYTHYCRDNGWTCPNTQDNPDFMVWYSGDCFAQPTPTPGGGGGTRPVCDRNAVTLTVNPNPVNTGQDIRFDSSGSQGDIYRSDDFTPNGGGITCSQDFPASWPVSKTCTASTGGGYTWTHSWRKCVGGFDINTQCSNICATSVNYTVNTPVTQPPTVTPTTLPTDTPFPTATIIPTATTVPNTPTATIVPTSTPAPTDTPIPTDTPLPTATPTLTPTPTPDFNINMCKCDGIEAVGPVVSGQNATFNAYAKVEGTDTSKATVDAIIFRIFEVDPTTLAAVRLTVSGPIHANLVESTSTKARYKATWTTRMPESKQGKLYMVQSVIQADNTCKRKTIAYNSNPFRTVVLADQTANVGFFQGIFNFFGSLFGSSQSTQAPSAQQSQQQSGQSTQVSPPAPAASSVKRPLQLQTFTPANVVETDNCQFIKFEFAIP